MCTAVPPPSPQQPPKYVRKDPPTPPKPTVHGPYSAKTVQLIRKNHGGGVPYFADGVLNRRAMYRFAVQRPKKNPLRVWQEGMRISRSHFLSRDEEHAGVVLEVRCATPKPPRILWRRLKARMASCDLDVVNPHGCMALCRFMYTEHGFAVPTMHDGGSHVHYREVATELWDRLAKQNSGRPGRRKADAIAGWPSTVKMTEQSAVWFEWVLALPLVDKWPFWIGGEAYPTPTMGFFYDNVICHVTPGPYLWPQVTSGPKPVVSDLLPVPKAPAARRRNLLLPEAAGPRACVTVTQTRQERFDQVWLQAAHGAARCLTIACQGLQE